MPSGSILFRLVSGFRRHTIPPKKGNKVNSAVTNSADAVPCQSYCNETEGPAEGGLGMLLVDVILLRHALDEYLPIRNSLIATDILLEILLAHCRSQRLQIKVLLGSLSHSRTGIDYHYRWLIIEGWLESIPCDKDHRVRYVIPSTKLLERAQAMISALNSKTHVFFRQENRIPVAPVINGVVAPPPEP